MIDHIAANFSALFRDYAFLLEILNGGAITPELIWLVLLTVYLVKEARRRNLHWFDWLHLPPSMNLILAIYVVDAGVTLRSITVWLWRVGGGGEFSALQNGLLIVGGGLIVLGYLCKIRALTSPDHGDLPWFVAGIITLVVVFLLVATH